MKGLLLKDFYTMIKQMKLFLLMIVIFTLIPGFSMAGFAIVYAAMLPITALAYDERSKWAQLAAMMPYKPVQLVLSKYLLGYIVVAVTLALTLAAQTLTGFAKGSPIGEMDVFATCVTAVVALLIQAFNLPLMFRFGVEKGRMLLLIVVAMSVMAVMGSGAFLMTTLGGLTAVSLRWAALALAGAVALNLLSIKIAVSMYEKREN